MEKIGYIYKITSPSGKVYIGQTFNLVRRLQKYKRTHCKEQKHLYNSILKYGWEAHNVEVVFQADCTKECLNRIERIYIKMYNSFENGLNLTKGGDGRLGCTPSDETKLKLSKAAKGRMLSTETKSRIVETRLERKSACKAINQYDLKGNLIKEWDSTLSASRELNIYPTNIYKCLKGTKKTAGGYIWKRR